MEQLTHIEESVRALWEKAKQAGELISRLRAEKQEVQQQNAMLLQEIAKLRAELSAKEQTLQKASAAATMAKTSAMISNGEREQLTAKVKELLARIDAYL